MNLLYCDENLLVINKPAGVPVLPEGWEADAPYLVKQLEAEFGRIWVVHRLDKVTSGVMVFARHAEAHRVLNAQFEKRQAKKVYHALLVGSPAWEEKTTRHPLRANVGHRHRTVVDDRNGKSAETHFKVRQHFAVATLVEAAPVTGRTHQVRVHAAAIGHPLLGDLLYGAPPTDLIGRPALHAYALTFCFPLDEPARTFIASYPNDFENAINILANLQK
ncbi:MAG: RluA family pseudouridine synthase [Anaerolineae bacterium]